MDFESWFFGSHPGSFALLAEYFYDDLLAYREKEADNTKLMIAWLEAAFEAGKQAAEQERYNG